MTNNTPLFVTLSCFWITLIILSSLFSYDIVDNKWLLSKTLKTADQFEEETSLIGDVVERSLPGVPVKEIRNVPMKGYVALFKIMTFQITGDVSPIISWLLILISLLTAWVGYHAIIPTK